ncbi:MAG: pyridoxal-phosphate dependent enzyme [Candidatus Pacebacteria bacterium]|nr:pyridoxal-phosphate dependent enzyme [Candidatus Paceibacterota bacterium]
MSNFQDKINNNEKGVWRYVDFYDEFIKSENRLYLEDGNSNVIEIENINKICKANNLYFKREDENETGSLKGRSLAYQVSLAKQNGKKELVISTSGNAGIAAAAYCQKAGIKLYIFISPETENAKISEMQKYNPIIIKSKKSIRLANYLSARYKIENLRPSVNDSSIEGFKSIVFEIFEKLGRIDALFTYVTSGSSFVGIGRAYQYLQEIGEIKKMPKLFAVQSGEISSIASEFESSLSFSQKERNGSIQSNNSVNIGAGKLGIKNTRRKNEILEFIKSSKGSGIYINNKDLQKATKLLEKNNIKTSQEGCASFTALIKEGKKNNFKKPVCILSGKLRDDINQINEEKIKIAENFDDVDNIIIGKFNCC